MIHLRKVPKRCDFQLIENQKSIKEDLQLTWKRKKERAIAANDDAPDRRPYWLRD